MTEMILGSFGVKHAVRLCLLGMGFFQSMSIGNGLLFFAGEVLLTQCILKGAII